MKFRPCIDIHNGQVKQIVGSSLSDQEVGVKENFRSEHNAAYYAKRYREDGLMGGHIILLNSKESQYYQADFLQAKEALLEFPGGMQVGGGITPENASDFLDLGAAHVIVTSYVFQNGMINYNNLNTLRKEVGKEHLVLDLSCRRKEKDYYVVTDRWQKYTKEKITFDFLDYLSEFCSEFLIHAVDVEGTASGIETDLISLLGNWNKAPITYAGGIGKMEDLEQIQILGNRNLDVTIGSALSIFGGNLDYNEVLEKFNS